MADLAGGIAAAARELAAHDHAAADAAIDLEEHEVLARAAERALREGRDVGVVGDVHRKARALAEVLLQRQIVPADVRGRDHDAGVRDDSRRADADAEHPSRRRFAEVVDQPLENRERLGRVTVGRPPDVRSMQHGARQVEHGAADLVRAREIDADDREAGAVEVDDDGGLARPRRLACALFADEARRHEVADERRDRDAGQPRRPREVRAAHRPIVEQRGENERAIVLAHLIGQRFDAATATRSGGRVRREDRLRHVCKESLQTGIAQGSAPICE